MLLTKIFALQEGDWAIIRRIAEGRVSANDRTRRKVCDLGSRSQNFAADYTGAAGEYGVEKFIAVALPEIAETGNGWGMRLTPKIMGRSVKEPDIMLYRRGHGKFIADVKSSTTPYCSINERQRKERPSPYYVPIRVWLDRGIEFFQPVTSSEVGLWELRDGHSPYRSAPFSQMEPLTTAEFRDWVVIFFDDSGQTCVAYSQP